MTYQQGNTIRFTAQFKDWNDADVDPTLIKVIIYDRSYKKFNEYSVGQANRIQLGLYYFDYVVNDIGEFVYEWYGEIDGTPSLQRKRFSVVKVS